MKNKTLIMAFAVLIIAMSSTVQETGTYKDSRDGKTYKTIKIGKQTWLAENLAYKAKHGCWAYNDNIGNVAIYGYLYNWKAAKKSCPAGWHLPSDAEWAILTTYLGGDSVAGGKLREIGSAHWQGTNTFATNSSGFNALPGGYSHRRDLYENIGKWCIWWSSTKYNITSVFSRNMGFYNNSSIQGTIEYKSSRFSVRCVKDN